MKPERLRQLEDLFDAALRQPASQRAEFVRQACPNPELRSELQALLQADAAADDGGFLKGSPVSSLADPPPAIKPGDTLGRYQILAPIGRGGMGEVFRAKDPKLRRDVAIKVLPVAFASDPDRIARFEREARAASALNHPNIVSIFDIGCDNGTYWIASELVEGQTLRRTLEPGALPAAKALEIASQVVAGLAAAHASGVVHRDLKPDNVMLTPSGHVKILDFGLAKQSRTSPDSTTADLTGDGGVLGTAGYMSPEQVRGETVDHRSDLFSFGVMLYEMLCGKRAFSGASSVEVMHAILKDAPPELPASVPPALARIVGRCLEKDLNRRFQSSADLGFALQSLAVLHQKRGFRWIWVALAAACLAAVAVYWFAVRRPSAPRETALTLRRVTNDLALSSNAAISPDGKLVAFVRNNDIWVQQVDGGGLIRITEDAAGATDPDFSADGTQVAFRSERDGGGIYVVPALGGEARELVPQGRRPRFSPDGKWILYLTGSPAEIPRDTKLFVQPLSGGAPTQLAVGCGVTTRSTVWSPDSARILFLGICGNDSRFTFWVSSVDGKERKSNRDLAYLDAALDQWIADPPSLLMRRRGGDVRYVLAVPVSPDGSQVKGPPQRLASLTERATKLSSALNGRIALSVDTSTIHIWGLPIDEKGRATAEPTQLTGGAENEVSPALSKDAGKMAFLSTRASNDSSLVYKDLATGREKELSKQAVNSPVFKPDGSGLVVAQKAKLTDPRNHLLYAPASGAPSKLIWDRSLWAMPWDWSPDGKTLLFFRQDDLSKVVGIIQQLDMDSLSATRFLDDPELQLWGAHFAPDGHWVTFEAQTPDRTRTSIYVAPFRKGPVPRSEWIRITQGDIEGKPRFSSDGKLLFYLSGIGGPSRTPRKLMAQRLKSDMHPDGNPFLVYPPPKSPSSSGIDFDEIGVGSRLVVFSRTESKGNIWVLEPPQTAAK